MFTYDDNDRLTAVKVTGGGVAMGSAERDYYAAAGARPSRWARYGLWAFLGACGTAMLLPLTLLGGSALGRRARRRRMVHGVIALLLAVLMIVGPENVQAMHAQVMLRQAVGSAVLADTGESNYTYSYDANGNLISISKGTETNTYVYDAENRMILADIRIGGVSTTAYGYDADGTRTYKTVLAGTSVTHRRYITDKNAGLSRVVAETDADGELVVRYTHGHELISQYRDESTSYYHYDGQMSVRFLTNASAVVGNEYTFDAYGNSLVSSGSTDNDFLYTGQQYDASTQLYYLRARYYQPADGRFMSVDPFGGSTSDPITLHKYLYTGANPVDRIDPNGMEFSIAGIMSSIALRANLIAINVASRVGPAAFVALTQIGFISLRAYVAIPRLLQGLMIATVTLEVGTSMVEHLTRNTIPIMETAVGPVRSGEVVAIDRGRMIEQIAGGNLCNNVKGIDDFRQGVATSIKSYRATDSQTLLREIERDLRTLDDATRERIVGKAYNGVPINILPNQIRARQLLVALPENTRVWHDNGFLQQLRNLSDQYKTVIRPTMVRLWRVRR